MGNSVVVKFNIINKATPPSVYNNIGKSEDSPEWIKKFGEEINLFGFFEFANLEHIKKSKYVDYILDISVSSFTYYKSKNGKIVEKFTGTFNEHCTGLHTNFSSINLVLELKFNNNHLIVPIEVEYGEKFFSREKLDELILDDYGNKDLLRYLSPKISSRFNTTCYVLDYNVLQKQIALAKELDVDLSNSVSDDTMFLFPYNSTEDYFTIKCLFAHTKDFKDLSESIRITFEEWDEPLERVEIFKHKDYYFTSDGMYKSSDLNEVRQYCKFVNL